MSQESRIEVVNRDGWRKDYPLQKGIVYIGSAPANDIVLDSRHGGGVVPLHAQLIANHVGYKLINLANLDIILGVEGGEVLPPRGVMDLTDGQNLWLGEFRLVFRGGISVGRYGAQPAGGDGGRSIGLSLAMPHTRLAPHQSLEGMVIAQNLGGKTGVRVEVDLEGLDEACYDIAPGPLLSSGAEKGVFFRIHHRGIKPLAGEWRLTFRATAPRAYPGEQATVTQRIEVLPLYRHRLWLLPPGSVGTPLAEDELLTPKAQDTPLRQAQEPSARSDYAVVSPDEGTEDWWGETIVTPAPQPEVVRPQAQPPVTKPTVKVERETGEQPMSVEQGQPTPSPAEPQTAPPESDQSSWLSRWWRGLTGALSFSKPKPDLPPDEAEVSTPAAGVAIDQAEAPDQAIEDAAESTALPETAMEQRPTAQVEPLSPAEERPTPPEPAPPITAMGEAQPLATEQITESQAGVTPLPEEEPEAVIGQPPVETEAEPATEVALPAAETGPTVAAAASPVGEEAAVAVEPAPAQMDEQIIEETEADTWPRVETKAGVTIIGEAEGWEEVEFEADTTVEETQALKQEADTWPQEEAEQTEEVEVGDWWDFEGETSSQVAEPQVIKLKAKAPSPVKRKEVAPEAEDLWRGD